MTETAESLTSRPSDARRATRRLVRTSRARATVVAVAPALMLAALVYHPYIARLNNDAAVAAELSSDTTRWGLSHLAVGVASGLVLLAFLAVAGHLREAGEQAWSTLALPFIVLGSTLFVFLPAMELAMLGAAEARADVPAILAELNRWFVPILVAGALAFAIGVLGLAVAITRSGVLSPWQLCLVVAALVVMATGRFVPLGAALYVSGAAGIVALWPLAYRMWRSPVPRSPVPRPPDSRSIGRAHVGGRAVA